jgi:glycosyltransferase involved in cell wall biosynthesis
MSYLVTDGHIELAKARKLSRGLLKYIVPWIRGYIGQYILFRLVLPHADHVFVQSEQMMKIVASRGVPKARMTPVPMGVDLDAMAPETVQPILDPRLVGRRILVYLGSLDRVRKVEVLFEMLQLVRQRVPNVLLVLAGDTDDSLHREWLRCRARKAGVHDSVVWTGWLPMERAWRYVRGAEVALSPMPRGLLLDVSSPTKLVEYMALGVPIVGNDSPEQLRTLKESGAGLCVPYTAEEFSSAVCTLLEMDSSKRMRTIAGGRRYVEANRDYRLIGARLADQYYNLIGSARATGKTIEY